MCARAVPAAGVTVAHRPRPPRASAHPAGGGGSLPGSAFHPPGRWLKRVRAGLAALAFVPLVGHGAYVPYSFKGVRLGASVTLVREKFPHVICQNRRGRIGERICGDPDNSIAGTRASVSFVLLRGKVARIGVWFETRDYARIVATVSERYGPPTQRKRLGVAARQGADRILVWQRGGQEIVATEYVEPIHRSHLTFAADGGATAARRGR